MSDFFFRRFNLNYYNYFTEIEDTFIRRRGKNLLLSPLDWAMMEGWQERGVPLHIVIRAIESVFDTFDKNPGPRTIKGLMYCREEVEAQYQEWIAMQAGKSAETDGHGGQPAFSREGISLHIQNAIDALSTSKNEALREDYDRAISRLEELEANYTEDFEALDQALCDIENFLDDAMLTKSDADHLKELKKSVAALIKPYKSGMEPKAYEETFNLMLLKQLREEENLPRLSLFYL